MSSQAAPSPKPFPFPHCFSYVSGDRPCSDVHGSPSGSPFLWPSDSSAVEQFRVSSWAARQGEQVSVSPHSFLGFRFVSQATEERLPGIFLGSLPALPAAPGPHRRPIPATPSSSRSVTPTGSWYLTSPFAISIRGILARAARVPITVPGGGAQRLGVAVPLFECLLSGCHTP